MAERLVPSHFHSPPKEGKTKVVIKSSHHEPDSTCNQSVVENRQWKIEKKYEAEIPDIEAGWGTKEQIVNDRMIVEKCMDQRISLYRCFID